MFHIFNDPKHLPLLTLGVSYAVGCITDNFVYRDKWIAVKFRWEIKLGWLSRHAIATNAHWQCKYLIVSLAIGADELALTIVADKKMKKQFFRHQAKT